MKITIEMPGYEEYFNASRPVYERGQRDKEEEIYQFLRKCGFVTDCKHGRPKWSCKDCLKVV